MSSKSTSARHSVLPQVTFFVHHLPGDDELIRSSAMFLLGHTGSWSTVSSYTRGSLVGTDYFLVTESLRGDGLDYCVVQITSVGEVMREVNRANLNTLIACALILFVDLCIAGALAVLLARPLNRMSRGMVDLAMLKFETSSPPIEHHRSSILQIDEMETAFLKLYNGVQSFAQYVSL